LGSTFYQHLKTRGIFVDTLSTSICGCSPRENERCRYGNGEKNSDHEENRKSFHSVLGHCYSAMWWMNIVRFCDDIRSLMFLPSKRNMMFAAMIIAMWMMMEMLGRGESDMPGTLHSYGWTRKERNHVIFFLLNSTSTMNRSMYIHACRYLNSKYHGTARSISSLRSR